MHKLIENNKAKFNQIENECTLLHKSNKDLRNEQKTMQDTLNEAQTKLTGFGQRISKAEEISSSLEGAVRILEKQYHSLIKNLPADSSEKFIGKLQEHDKYIAEIIKYIRNHHR